MTELSISKESLIQDFLSKDNTTSLYKTIISKNELDNITKKEKEKILSSLLETMKDKYKTLKFSQINKNNMNAIKSQFNNICINTLNPLIDTIKKTQVNNNPLHDRKFDRDFNTVKKTVSISDRPASSIHIDTTKSVSLSDKLKDLEESRNSYIKKPVVDVPDFLKPIKVGKVDMMYNNNNKSTEPPKTLLGYSSEPESNFSSVSLPSSKFNDSMTVQQRLAQLEQDRQMPPSQDNSIQQASPNSQSNGFPPPQQTSVHAQNNSQSNGFPPPQQTSVHAQNNSQSNGFPPPQQISNNSYNNSQNNSQQEFQQTSNTQQYQNNSIHDEYRNHTIQGGSQYNNLQLQSSQESINMINSLSRVINEMKMEIDSLKQTKKQTSKKSLQLEINKIDSIYKYVFSPVDNIINLKLVSYYLPEPCYNIIEDTYFNYYLDNNDCKIHIMKGYYNISRLIEILNRNNDLIFSLDEITLRVRISTSDDTKVFKIIHTCISMKLGFNASDNIQTISAERLPDLRLPTKLNLYITNLQESPIGILNFNGSSVCNLNFMNQITLNKLDIKFTTEDNIVYNFNGVPYNLSFMVDILVDSVQSYM